MAARFRNPAAIELLESLLDMARSGEITRVFAVYGDEDACYNHEIVSDDVGDLILQVRSEVIVAQAALNKPEVTPKPPHH